MDYGHLPRGRRKSPLPRLLLAGFVVLTIAAGFAFYEYRKHPAWSEKVAEYRERANTWLSERKKNMHHGIAKVKNPPAESDDDRPVNFEFYNTLQDMKSMSVDAHANAQKKLTDKENAAQISKNPPLQGFKKSQQAKISHAADLENDLLAAMKKNAGED